MTQLSAPPFWPSLAVCSGFCMLDGLISTLSLGLYHGGSDGQALFHVNLTQILNHLTFKDGYAFSHSPFEFVPLQILRSLILLMVLLPLRFAAARNPSFASWYSQNAQPQPWQSRLLNLLLIGLEICNFSYSLVKLLAFSDRPEQLFFPGVWLNVMWNIGAFLGIHALHLFWLCRKQREDERPILAVNVNVNGEANAYQPLLNDAANAAVANSNHSLPESVVSGGENVEQSENLAISTWAHIRCLLHYCWQFWGWLIVGFIFLIIYSIARIFVPYYTAQVISNIVRTRDMHAFFKSVGFMSFLLSVATIFGGLRAGVLNYTTAQIERLMRRDLFLAITSQEIAFFDQAQTGEILSRLIADCETMSMTISTNVNIFLRNGLMVLGSVVFMLGMSWRLTAVTLIVIPPIAFFTKMYSAYYDHLSTRTQECKAGANRIAEEVVSSMRNVRAFACEQKEQHRFEKQLDETLRVHKKKSIALCGFQCVNELANNCILVAILAYGGYLVLSGRMTTDQMFAFLLYQLQLGENFYMLNSVATGLMECVGASRKVFEYLQRTPRISLQRGTLQPEQILGKVEFRNVAFAYPIRPNTLVLKNISFVIQPGEMIALVGPSGAGKSSVIALLEHFYEPLQGQILLDDRPIEQYEHRFFHQKVSLVSQEPTLYACSIRDNILYGCDDLPMEEVVAAARLANIHQFVADSEQGYDTRCGEKGVQMSGGQKQRIAIARALIRQPAVLILDEATSALDAESEHVIQEALLQCSQGRTVLLIAHRLSTVEKADRIIVLDAGRIVQIGNHNELMAQPEGLYHSLVKRQLLGTTRSDE